MRVRSIFSPFYYSLRCVPFSFVTGYSRTGFFFSKSDCADYVMDASHKSRFKTHTHTKKKQTHSLAKFFVFNYFFWNQLVQIPSWNEIWKILQPITLPQFPSSLCFGIPCVWSTDIFDWVGVEKVKERKRHVFYPNKQSSADV